MSPPIDVQVASPFDVEPGESRPTSFSPQVGRKFTGIQISAPPRVVASLETPPSKERPFYIPISMVYGFNIPYFSKFSLMEAWMVVFALESRGGKPWAGTLLPDNIMLNTSPRPVSPIPQAEREKMFAIKYLTFNLAEFLPLSYEEALYHVHVGLEEHKSNVVTVEVLRGRL